MKWFLLAIPIFSGCCYDNCLLHGDWTIGFKHEACGYDCDGTAGASADERWSADSHAGTGKFHPVPTRPVFEPPRYAPEEVGERLGEEVPAKMMPERMMPSTPRPATTLEQGRRRSKTNRLTQESTAPQNADADTVDRGEWLASSDGGHQDSQENELDGVPASYTAPAEEVDAAASPAGPSPKSRLERVPVSEWRPSRRAAQQSPEDLSAI